MIFKCFLLRYNATYALQDWAPCEAPSSVLGRAEEKSSMPPPPPRQGMRAAATTIALVRR